MHSILQTTCDNISTKLQVTVKLLQVSDMSCAEGVSRTSQ